MSILQRTIKLVLATTLAIIIADYLHLTYATSAGVIAILSVLDTRKSTFAIACQRLLSALLALSIAIALFYVFGYHLWVFSVYIAFYVPLAYYWKLETGIAPVTVLILHLFSEKSISPLLIVNELSLLLVGAGTALVLNLYMPSKQKAIADYFVKVEEELKVILCRFGTLLRSGDGSNDGQLIDHLEKTLSEALELVYIESNNQLFQSTNYQVHYFEMRREQEKILKGMSKSIQKLNLQSQENQILAELFERTGQQISEENPANDLIVAIEDFLEHFRERPLPVTRDEFEGRALLFQLLGDLERFIQLKVDFYDSYKP